MDRKFRSCKHLIEAKVHTPLQIRTNKHRCFVFCGGHTSLTCVPGIGHKNRSRLHQMGIQDLTQLFIKYRQINDMQRFQRWLESDVGFTSYQAKMATCAIAAKLGDIHEINTGLTPICCPSEERRKRMTPSRETRISSPMETSKRLKPESLYDTTLTTISSIHGHDSTSMSMINAGAVSNF